MTPPGPIPDSYWVVLGKLAAGEYAGSAFRESTREKLERFLNAGIRSFIDLTEDDELRSYVGDLQELAAARGMSVQHFRMAVRDLSVPSMSQLRDILDLIDRCIAEGSPVYVHCWGGIGRTGTIIGCWLARNGLTGPAALRRIEELRAGTPDGYVQSPETAAQRAYVLAFAAGETRQT